MVRDLNGLVDSENGLVSRRIFIEPEIYSKSWSGSLPAAGCFCATRARSRSPAISSPPIWARTRCWWCATAAGKVHAFLNVCRHRGNRLCRADTGNAATFTCAYHGWTYRNDGRLAGVPYLKEAYHDELDRERWGLVPVAQLDSYKGLLFATFDAAGAAAARISRRDDVVSRRVFRPPRGRHRDHRRHAQMDHAVQLEVPRRKLRRRWLPRQWSHLSAMQTGSGGDFACNPDPKGGHALPRQRPLSIIGVGPDMIGRPAGAGNPGLRGGRSAPEIGNSASALARMVKPDRRHGVPELLDAARHLAHLARLASARPRQDRSVGLGLYRQGGPGRRSRRRSAWPAREASARPAPSSRTTWTIGRGAPRPGAASWPGAMR